MKNHNSHLFMGKPVVKLNAVVRPVNSICNLRCDYCFYFQNQDKNSLESDWKMSYKTLENFIRKYVKEQNCEEIVFSWKGSEPTLMGLEFFEKAIEFQKKYAPSHVYCENYLQTNGVLLDEKWCKFLKENNFIVDIAIDGTKELHNEYRKDNKDKGTFDAVMKTISLFKKYKIPFNSSTCVNGNNAKHPLEVYRFLRDKVQPDIMQFIPIVKAKNFDNLLSKIEDEGEIVKINDIRINPDHPDSVMAHWSVKPDDYGKFLIKIFDEWFEKDRNKVSVAFFESAIRQWTGGESNLCVFSSYCGKFIVVEYNGDTYCCGHCIYPEYKLGNINNESISDMFFSNKQKKFANSKKNALPKKCQECKWVFACGGGCLTDRIVKTEDGELGLNYLCEGLQNYFEHINPFISEIVKEMGRKVFVVKPDNK